MADCEITEIASCFIEKFYEFLINLFNTPLNPLLGKIKSLLLEPVNIHVFSSLWSLVVYIISIFYGLLFLYSGIIFITSGSDILKREKAKIWLKNTFMMMFFVQSSFLFYSLIIEISYLLNKGSLTLINNNFFYFTPENLSNIGLDFVFSFFYLAMLFITLIFLVIRYILISLGVVFFALGLFFYFIPLLESYGRMILNILFVMIFITFPQILILAAGSKIINIYIFSDFRIIVVTASFALINLTYIAAILFTIIKAASSTLNSNTDRLTSIFIPFSRFKK